MRIKELDLEKLGGVLLRATPASVLAHHKWPKATMKDYVIPDGAQPEVEFVRDLFTLTTQELADKWYDGEQNAIGFIK